MQLVKLLIAGIFLHHSATAQIPQGIQLDGSLSFAEMSDTLYFRQVRTGTADVFLKKSNTHYYLNVHSSTLANVLVMRQDTLWVIHASGSVGRGIYQKNAAGSFLITKTLLPVTEHPGSWDMVGPFVNKRFFNQDRSDQQVQNDIARCLQQNGYTATTFDMGSRYDFEFLFTRQFLSGSKILIAYADRSGVKKHFPLTSVFTGDAGKDGLIYSGSLDAAGVISVSSADWFLLD